MHARPLNARNAIEIIRRFRERRRFHVVTPKRFVKVYCGQQKHALNRELAAALFIPTRQPWKHVNLVFNRNLIHAGPGTIAYAPRIKGSPPSPDQCRAIAAELLEHMSPSIPLAPWCRTVGPHVISEIVPNLDAGTWAHLEHHLNGVMLPSTGAHGDLKDVNMLIDGGRGFFIVDWEFFRPEGSAIEDICRLLAISVRSERVQAGLPFVPGEDVHIIWNSHVMRQVSETCQLTELQAIALEIISRASCERLGGRNLSLVLGDMRTRVNAFSQLEESDHAMQSCNDISTKAR